ncbi:MAG: hypothetical protein K5790_10265 [Nitrosopumilus sp.]|uniref:hypothetical protein n=1 Tax=Nitrosopumilus sp. TaxID=2024843 RepID=UPI00247C2173|nr:hypothetical protein [Nitrosopumilus sp.]MCV0393653.1 hypothetical protein [Nitrosopumilus sp.]
MQFLKAMQEELDNHRDEKLPLRFVDRNEVKGLLENSIAGRATRIRLSKKKSEIQKQCVHTANEAMMIWLKFNE